MPARLRYDVELNDGSGGHAQAAAPPALARVGARVVAHESGDDTRNVGRSDMNDAKGRGSAAAAEAAAVDRALLARVAARDAVAFRALAGRHLGVVLVHARRMLRDDAEAEDVAQEAMLRLWQQAAALDVGELGVRPWLRRVASNLCIDRIRAGRRVDVTDEVPEQEAEPDQLVGLEQKDLAARVDAALRALPERQRIALTLFQYDGLSQIEIGEKLGVSDEAVESLLSRARRTLRKLLNDDWRRLVSES